MKTLVYLVRHGETCASSKGIYYGRSDSEVTEEGWRQIDALAQRFRSGSISGVYSSPLSRCYEAACRIATVHGLVPEVIADLTEIDHGHWEGLDREELFVCYGDTYAAWRLDPAGNAPVSGEYGYAVALRVVPVINELARKHRNQRVVVVSHNTVNRIILCHYLGIPITNYREKVVQFPAALNCVEFADDGSAVVTLMNDIAHWRFQLEEVSENG